MKLIEMPHKTADYLCPVSGLCDVYEWKTGVRVPEKLLSYVRTGFMLISSIRMDPPKMIFMTQMNIGKQLFEFWSRHMEYELISSGGKTFATTIREVKELIDKGIPVILFGLDMFYLSYQEKFYEKIHIPGHVVMMIGYDEHHVYVLDNSKKNIEKIPYMDLEKAWKEKYYNISKRNTYFALNFEKKERDTSLMLRNAYREMSKNYLEPKLSFIGTKGLERYIREFQNWESIYPKDMKRKIHLDFIRFAGSVLPELPVELDGNQLGLLNPHGGLRDQLAEALLENEAAFGNEHWKTAATHLRKSSKCVENIVKVLTEEILTDSYEEGEIRLELLRELKEHDENAFSQLGKG